MPRKPLVDYKGVKIWRVYDGSESRAYWFAWDADHTEDGDTQQFDIRELSTYVEDNGGWRKAKKFLMDSIDKGEILPDGPVPRDDNDIEEHRPEKLELERKAYEAERKELWDQMVKHFAE